MVNGVQYVMMDLELLMLVWLVNNWDTAIINHMTTYLCKLTIEEVLASCFYYNNFLNVHCY